MGYFVNFWSKASDMLWAGSVDMSRTLSLSLESRVAKLQLVEEEGGGRRGEGMEDEGKGKRKGEGRKRERQEIGQTKPNTPTL